MITIICRISCSSFYDKFSLYKFHCSPCLKFILKFLTNFSRSITICKAKISVFRNTFVKISLPASNITVLHRLYCQYVAFLILNVLGITYSTAMKSKLYHAITLNKHINTKMYSILHRLLTQYNESWSLHDRHLNQETVTKFRHPSRLYICLRELETEYHSLGKKNLKCAQLNTHHKLSLNNILQARGLN